MLSFENMEQTLTLKESTLLAEGEIIDACLLKHKYHRSKVAIELGIDRSTLWKKMRDIEDLREKLKTLS